MLWETNALRRAIREWISETSIVVPDWQPASIEEPKKETFCRGKWPFSLGERLLKQGRSAPWIIHPSLRPHNMFCRALLWTEKLSSSPFWILNRFLLFVFSSTQMCFQAGAFVRAQPKREARIDSDAFVSQVHPRCACWPVFVRWWKPLNKCLINSSGGTIVSPQTRALYLSSSKSFNIAGHVDILMLIFDKMEREESTTKEHVLEQKKRLFGK